MNLTLTELKTQLWDLQNEQLSFQSNLNAAIAAGDSKEIVRLKGRSGDLAPEIYATKIGIQQAEISELQTRLTENRRDLLNAQQALEDFNLLDAPLIAAKKDDLERETRRGLMLATAIKQAENQLRTIGSLINEAERKLKQIVESN